MKRSTKTAVTICPWCDAELQRTAVRYGYVYCQSDDGQILPKRVCSPGCPSRPTSVDVVFEMTALYA